MDYTYDNYQYNKFLKNLLIIIFIILLIALVVYLIIVYPTLSTHYYAVIFRLNTGEENIVLQVKKNDLVDKIDDPVMDGYNFLGWVNNDVVFDFNEKITQNTILEAIWIPKTVDTGNISDDNQIIYSSNNDNSNYDNTPIVNISSSNNSNIPIERFEVVFDSNGGSNIPNASVIKYGVIDKPDNPTREGYIFVGWTYNGLYYDFNDKVFSDLVLIAEWKLGDNSSTNSNSTPNSTEIPNVATPQPTTTSIPQPTATSTPKPTSSTATSTPKPTSPTATSTPPPTAPTTTSTPIPVIKKLNVTLNQQSQIPSSGDWASSRTIRSTFSSSNASGVKYYIKSSVNVTTSSNVVKASCGTGDNPGSCKSISTKNLSANVWYQLKNTVVDVIYTQNGLLSAKIVDGSNDYFDLQYSINNIDSDIPSIPNVQYLGGASSHSWKNNYKIKLTSSAKSGIKYYEIDTDGNGTADLKTSDIFVPGNGFSSCNVRFRSVSGVDKRSAWTSFQDIHMDTEAPTKTTVDTGNYIKGTWTTGKVDRTFNASDNVAIHHFEWSNSACSSYAGSEAVYYDSNGIQRPVTYIPLSGGQINIACHRAVDYAGNVGPWSDKTVIKIQEGAIFIGDSITAGISSNPYYSWADAIGNKYGIKIKNSGYPGWFVSNFFDGGDPNDSISDGHWLKEVVDKENDLTYEYVILHGGVNDLNGYSLIENAPYLLKYGRDGVTGGLTQYLDAAINKWPNAKIGYIINYKTFFKFDGVNFVDINIQRQWYNYIKEELEKRNIPYLDLFDGMAGNTNLTYDQILGVNLDNNSIISLYNDNLHITRESYDNLAPYIYNWMLTIPRHN